MLSNSSKPSEGPAPDHLGRVATQCLDALGPWYDRNARSLPWRETADPYAVWVSEIMLQQTRVDQAVGYFKRFVSRFPELTALARAELDDVLLLWEGLGYYSRARNLHRGARTAINRHGRVPDSFGALLALPGIGPYTAAAIASIAYGERRAAVDGNVVRVLTRLFLVDSDATSSHTRAVLQKIADALVPARSPGRHNQALMELGATVCLPRHPRCEHCPLVSVCLARIARCEHELPFKPPAKRIPHIDVVVGLIRDAEGRYLITRRPENAMLGGLWEFPGGKRRTHETDIEALERELAEELGIVTEVGDLVFETRHAYSHFRITLRAYSCNISSGRPNAENQMPMAWADVEAMREYAFPRANRKLIEVLPLRAGGTSASREEKGNV